MDGSDSVKLGEIYLEQVELVLMVPWPPLWGVRLAGSLPTPGHQLDVQILAPDTQNRIRVLAASRYDPELISVQMLQPFDRTFPLGVLAPGRYRVWVNAETAGEFETRD